MADISDVPIQSVGLGHLGIFPLIGIGNFERGPKPDLLIFLNVRAQFVAERRRALNITLANLSIRCLQCGNNFRLDLN